MRKLAAACLLLSTLSLGCNPPSAEAHQPTVDAHLIEHRHLGHGHSQYRSGRGTESHTWDWYRYEAALLRGYLKAAWWARVAAYVRAVEASQDPRVASENAAREFGIPVGDFLRVIDCESGFNPSAVNSSSGALGLGQHLPSYWGGRAAALGYGYEDWDNARANARVSAWLWATSGPQHWVCY